MPHSCCPAQGEHRVLPSFRGGIVYLGTKVDLASVNTHGVSQYVDKCVLSKPVTSSQMCRVKGVLSHCCLRPGRNRILAPCQPSLLPSLSSPAAMTFNCELGVCVHTHKCMCVCVCLGVHAWVCMWRSEDSLKCCSSGAPAFFVGLS